MLILAGYGGKAKKYFKEKPMDEIYFGTKDGDLLDNYDIAKIAYVKSNRRIALGDIDGLRDYAKTCKGITREISDPSVKWLLEHGHKEKAVKLYWRKHPGIGLKEAKETVDCLERNYKK